MGMLKIWEFSVCGVNVSARLCRATPYGTYIPAYGGGGGGVPALKARFNLVDNFVHSIFNQPEIGQPTLGMAYG